MPFLWLLEDPAPVRTRLKATLPSQDCPKTAPQADVLTWFAIAASLFFKACRTLLGDTGSSLLFLFFWQD